VHLLRKEYGLQWIGFGRKRRAGHGISLKARSGRRR
jgi:hypothetical protein